MGHVEHDALIVTCWDDQQIRDTHALAMGTSADHLVTPIVSSTINGDHSFAVLSCGSKSGWQAKRQHTAALESIVKWMDAQRNEDGSSALEWVWVCFGNDMEGEVTTRNSSENHYYPETT